MKNKNKKPRKRPGRTPGNRPGNRLENKPESKPGRKPGEHGPGMRAGHQVVAGRDHKSAREALADSARLLQTMADFFSGWTAQAAGEIVTRLNKGGTIICCGNGGSAADAQHVAAELAGKFYLNRRALPAVSITTNTSSVTAISNDYGYDQVFSKQIEGLGRPGDVLLAFSTSGVSPNVVNAVSLARKMGLFAIGFTGAGGIQFAGKCDMCLIVPSSDCPRIQEAHIAVCHSICFLVERAIFGGK